MTEVLATIKKSDRVLRGGIVKNEVEIINKCIAVGDKDYALVHRAQLICEFGRYLECIDALLEDTVEGC